MGLTKGASGPITEVASGNIMAVKGPILLDSLINNISVQSAKSAHQDGMHLSLMDPNNNLLSLINPGDWIVCWMFDNTTDSEKLRAQLRLESPPALNQFNSGLKFVGKCLAPRMQHISGAADGTFIKRCTLQATAFSELDSNMYYDPYVGSTNLAKGLQFIQEITKTLNEKFNGIPRKVDEILGVLIPTCLGSPIRSGGQSTPNSPMRVPDPICSILGFKGAKTFMDVLTAILGIQKYGDTYIPPLSPGINVTVPDFVTIAQQHTTKLTTHKNIYETGKPLTGAILPQIAPFNNVPVWSILEQHLVPVVNEMYSTLKLGVDGGITPHLIVRQIPFNSDAFVSSSPSDYTAFRELPRWKVEPEMVLSYDTGKSNSMRVNYVHVQAIANLNNGGIQAFNRVRNIPRWDSVDIARNGLKPFITQVNAVYTPTSTEIGQKWTDMATDRLIGAHLKLSGSISVVGVQEPVCVGDNLEYDGFVYHIESLEHRLQVNPASGHKSFSTHLAISYGVPASGPVLPELAIRQFESQVTDAIDAANLTPRPSNEIRLTRRSGTSKLTGTTAPVMHSVVPASNVEED